MDDDRHLRLYLLAFGRPPTTHFTLCDSERRTYLNSFSLDTLLDDAQGLGFSLYDITINVPQDIFLDLKKTYGKDLLIIDPESKDDYLTHLALPIVKPWKENGESEVPRRPSKEEAQEIRRYREMFTRSIKADDPEGIIYALVDLQEVGGRTVDDFLVGTGQSLLGRYHERITNIDGLSVIMEAYDKALSDSGEPPILQHPRLLRTLYEAICRSGIPQTIIRYEKTSSRGRALLDRLIEDRQVEEGDIQELLRLQAQEDLSLVKQGEADTLSEVGKIVPLPLRRYGH